jgi:hypothetical protein
VSFLREVGSFEGGSGEKLELLLAWSERGKPSLHEGFHISGNRLARSRGKRIHGGG